MSLGANAIHTYPGLNFGLLPSIIPVVIAMAEKLHFDTVRQLPRGYYGSQDWHLKALNTKSAKNLAYGWDKNEGREKSGSLCKVRLKAR
jgi:hypothetical protein